MARKIEVEIVGDTRKLKGALKDSESATKRWAGRMDAISGGRRGGLGSTSGLLKGGGIALGAGIATQQIMELSKAASDLNEQQTKSQAVFGASAAGIEKWSDTTARALGISKRAALEASGTFGNLFTTVGITGQGAADMSKGLVQLASDLASFNNANPADVLDALRSGLIGEAEPMRRYGVLLSEVRVQQQAMADTGKTNAKALTNQEKTMARYEIILGDTGKAQGDFAKTAGGLANQQRILAAQAEDLKGKLGKRLLPVIVRITTAANDAATAALDLGDALKKLDDSSGGLGGGLINELTKSPWGEMTAFVKVLSQGHPITFGEAPSQTLETLNNVKAINEALGQTPALAASWSASFGLGALTTSAGLRPGARPEEGTRGPKPIVKPPPRKGATAEQKNRWFDSDITRRLDMVQDVKTLRGQVAALDEIAGLIRKRLAITNDITRRRNLEDQLRSVARQRSGLTDQIVADAAEAKRQAKALAEQAAAIKLAQRTARQFRALGLTATGEEPVASAANLRKQLAQLSSRSDLGSLSSKLKGQLAKVRKLLKTENPTREIRDYIQGLFATIRQELNKGDQAGPLTATTQLSERILAGLGLSANDARILRARLSHFNSAGSSLTGAGAGSVTLTSYTVIDGKVIAKTSAKHNRRTSTVNAKPRNGPSAGGYVGA